MLEFCLAQPTLKNAALAGAPDGRLSRFALTSPVSAGHLEDLEDEGRAAAPDRLHAHGDAAAEAAARQRRAVLLERGPSSATVFCTPAAAL